MLDFASVMVGTAFDEREADISLIGGTEERPLGWRAEYCAAYAGLLPDQDEGSAMEQSATEIGKYQPCPAAIASSKSFDQPARDPQRGGPSASAFQPAAWFSPLLAPQVQRLRAVVPVSTVIGAW
jgi:hypothetical protein